MSDLNENYTENPGIRLRRAREACELSLGDVASHLKLSPEIIESLESGEVESIAAPVFVAGYLRSYARLVNLSGDEIIADFKALTAMKSPSMDPASSPASNDYGQVDKASSLNISLGGNTGLAGTLILGTIIVVLVVAGYVYFSGKEEAPGIKETSKIGSTTMGHNELLSQKGQQDVLSGDESSDSDRSTNIESIKPELPELSTEGEESTEEVEKTVIPAPFTASSGNVSNPSAQSENYSELSLFFTEDSWVEVKDSEDKRLMYQMGKSGMSRTVTGLAPFNVRLGFVNGVSVMYNGKPYDLSHYENRKSVRLQIGKEGDRMSGGE